MSTSVQKPLPEVYGLSGPIDWIKDWWQAREAKKAVEQEAEKQREAEERAIKGETWSKKADNLITAAKWGVVTIPLGIVAVSLMPALRGAGAALKGVGEAASEGAQTLRGARAALRHNPEKKKGEAFWGEPVSVYTRAQAIEDGVLVDLGSIAPQVTRQHYKYPVACTAAVWGIIEQSVQNPRYANDYPGVIHDILWMSRMNVKQLSQDQSIALFQVIIHGAGRKRLYTFKIVAGPGDKGEPVLTVLLPDED